MKWPNPDTLKKFVENNIYPSISFYLPTHIHGEEARQDPIRLKNLITECRDVLKKSYPQERAAEILKPASDLVRDAIFWQHQSNGLAMFITPDFSEHVQLSIKPDTSLYVGSLFRVLPLIEAYIDNGIFYLLVLSQHIVKLFEANHYTKTEIELPNTPRNIEELLRFDIAEENISARSLPPGSISGKGAMYYGSADLKLSKRNIERYVQIIATAVDKKLINKSAPLIIAAVEYEQSMFRMHSTYPYLISKGMYGNPDQIKTDSLHNEAWDILADYIKKNQEKYITLYNDFSNTDKTSCDLNEIMKSAYMGRIDTLFVDMNKRKYGIFDTHLLTTEIHEQQELADEDLLNWAAIYTLKKEGRVFPLNKNLTNKNQPVAAIFRY
ncbi:MAG: hypothetical protein ABFD79_02500 [Phycisphaerales bacterium]